MVDEHILDTVHLVIMEAVLEFTLALVVLHSVVGSNSSTTGGGAMVNTLSVHLANVAIAVDADMRCKHHHDVTVLWGMATECSPTSLSGMWDTTNSTDLEDLAPSESE